MFPLKNRLTHNDLMQWKRNKLLNPITNRKIKKNGYTFNKLNKIYLNKFPLDFDYLDCIDNKDPITLKKFWIIENDKKKFIYKNLDNLILYKDINNNFRCIEKESLRYLKTYNIRNHPVTFDEIPKKIWNSVNEIKKDKDLNIEKKSERIFKIFDSISIFINHNDFINLDKNKLKKFNYEAKEFYYENLSTQDRILIDKKDGKQILSKKSKDLDNESLNYIQNYLLDQIEKLLLIKIENLKFMINYILIGALGLVIPNIKKNYPNFSFNF
jgi:hypothetical protein